MTYVCIGLLYQVQQEFKSLTNECIVILENYNSGTNLDNFRVLNKFIKFTEASGKIVI